MRYFIQFALLLLLIQGAFAESIEVNDFENSSQESRYLDLIDNIRCPQLRRDLSCFLETVGHQRTHPMETFGFYLNSGRCRARVPAGSMRCVGQATHPQASRYASETKGFPKDSQNVPLHRRVYKDLDSQKGWF
jgi:hypothetical protein